MAEETTPITKRSKTQLADRIDELATGLDRRAPIVLADLLLLGHATLADELRALAAELRR